MSTADITGLVTQASGYLPDVVRFGVLVGVLWLLWTTLLVIRDRARQREIVSHTVRRYGTLARARARQSSGTITASVDIEEFTAILGEPPASYRLRTYAMAAIASIAVFIVTGGAWSVSALALIGIPYWRASRARSRIRRVRDDSFSSELLPFARQMESHLAGGTPLAAALAELVRSARATPLLRAIRRALSNPAGLTEGLRAEEDRAPTGVVREFFEILAEGSTTSQRPAVVAETLHAFVAASTRRQAAWRAALRASIDARQNRTTVLIIAPSMLVLNILSTGGHAILHTTLGNMLVLVVGSLLTVAFVLTEFALARLTKGF